MHRLNVVVGQFTEERAFFADIYVDQPAARRGDDTPLFRPPRNIVAALVNQDAVAVNQKLDILFVLKNLVQLFPLVFEMLKGSIIKGSNRQRNALSIASKF